VAAFSSSAKRRVPKYRSARSQSNVTTLAFGPSSRAVRKAAMILAPEQAPLHGIHKHGFGKTVLDAAAGVEELALGVYGQAF